MSPHCLSENGDSSPPTRALRVAVIGAGCAGLASARELTKEGHDVQVFEQKSNVGGIWDYEEQVEDDLLGLNPARRRVHSSLYSSLRINLPREIMSFSDFPFIPVAMGGRSRDPRTYCEHAEVQAWLEAFVEAFDLRRLIRFHTRVVDLRPLEMYAANGAHQNGAACTAAAPRWSLTSERLDANGQGPVQREEVFDAVLVAVGNYYEPNLPDIEGMERFPGLQLHCHNYRHAARFSGKRVLVVGASFSGLEIAHEVADVAAQVYHSARTWGERIDDPAPRPNLERLPMLAALTPDGGARFGGGAAVGKLDAVLYCTGYKYRYPFLERTGLLSTGPVFKAKVPWRVRCCGDSAVLFVGKAEDQRVHPLYKHIFVYSVAPTLALIGLLWKSLRNAQFELQAKWAAQVLSGRVRLPSRADMEADTHAFYSLLQRSGVPVRYTHCQMDGVPVGQIEYNAFLGAACAPPLPPMEVWRQQLHDIAAKKILTSNDTFRDEVVPEERPAFEAASRACAEMWERHKLRRRGSDSGVS